MNYPIRNLGQAEPVCCQATADGGVVCSDGMVYPPGCPKAPQPNVPGVAGEMQAGTLMIPQPPSATDCAPSTPAPTQEVSKPADSEGVSWWWVAAAALGGIGTAGILGYFIFKK